MSRLAQTVLQGSKDREIDQTIYYSHSTQSLWVYKYNRQDVLVILQSLLVWVYKYNRQDVLVILQSLWVYKYNRQDVLVILQSLWVYKYNRQDVLVILQSLWVYKYNRQHVPSTVKLSRHSKFPAFDYYYKLCCVLLQLA